jgi:biopolymer transport protein ExbD
MRKCFDWLIEHEKLLVGVILILVVALIVQIKFCKTRVESDVDLAQNQPSSQLESFSDSTINVTGTWEMSVQKRSGTAETWTLKLKQEGERLTGTINSLGGDLPVEGTIKGQEINLSA